jgi:hypothetical protein
MSKKGLLLCVTLLLIFLPIDLQGQCAMCRAVLESNGDQSVAEGINNGIVYLMAIPYILVGSLIFIVYRKLKS